MGWHAWRGGGAAARRAFGAAPCSIAAAGRWDCEAEADLYASPPPGWTFFLPDDVPWPAAGFTCRIAPIHAYQVWPLGALGPWARTRQERGAHGGQSWSGPDPKGGAVDPTLYGPLNCRTERCALSAQILFKAYSRGFYSCSTLCAYTQNTHTFVENSKMDEKPPCPQVEVVVVVAVVVAAAPPPMPPAARVHPLAVVPRQALVTMCHRNPGLMGQQPAGSQDCKRPSQRSVLAGEHRQERTR